MRNKRLKVKLDNVFHGVKTNDITAPFVQHAHKEETPLMFVPKNCEYVEIDGIRLDNVGDFDKFIERLQTFKETEKKLNEMINKQESLIEYLIEKLETAKLMATYENGIRYPSAQERIYEDILNRVESGDYER